VILDDERRGIRRDAVFPVVDRNVPDDLSVGAIERDQPRVEAGDDHEIAGERDAAMDGAAAQHGVESVPVLGIVMPENVAGLGVDGEGASVVGAEIKGSVAEQRRSFQAAELAAGGHRPRVSLGAVSGVISVSGL
jgi:hypothetical protein